ncbi:hypothetical protein HDK77DRAFT_170670 [Phyllosticta capitalensis]
MFSKTPKRSLDPVYGQESHPLRWRRFDERQVIAGPRQSRLVSGKPLQHIFEKPATLFLDNRRKSYDVPQPATQNLAKACCFLQAPSHLIHGVYPPKTQPPILPPQPSCPALLRSIRRRRLLWTDFLGPLLVCWKLLIRRSTGLVGRLHLRGSRTPIEIDQEGYHDDEEERDDEAKEQLEGDVIGGGMRVGGVGFRKEVGWLRPEECCGGAACCVSGRCRGCGGLRCDDLPCQETEQNDCRLCLPWSHHL